MGIGCAGGGSSCGGFRGAERTTGTGAFLGDGWRSLNVHAGRGTRLRLAGSPVWVERVDASPPQPFAWDVVRDVPIEGEALAEVAEVRGERLLPLSAEGDASQVRGDGECWIHVEATGVARALRAHLPQEAQFTEAPRLDLARRGLHVDLSLDALTATFLQAGATAIAQGECVRMLAVYVRARTTGDGWLTAEQAWSDWVELGGSSSTRGLGRMSSERGKLRQQLAAARVASLGAVFESRKFGSYVATRLGIVLERRERE